MVPPIVVADPSSLQPLAAARHRSGFEAGLSPPAFGFTYPGIEPGTSCRRRSRMKRIIIGALVVSAAMAMAAGAATQATHHASAAKSLTGCLEKGDEANTFKLTHVTGGGDWELVGAPASLKMSDHVGHKVEVSGTMVSAAAAEKMEHSPAGQKEKQEMKSEKGESHLKVTALKHVSPTCP